MFCPHTFGPVIDRQRRLSETGTLKCVPACHTSRRKQFSRKCTCDVGCLALFQGFGLGAAALPIGRSTTIIRSAGACSPSGHVARRCQEGSSWVACQGWPAQARASSFALGSKIDSFRGIEADSFEVCGGGSSDARMTFSSVGNTAGGAKGGPGAPRRDRGALAGACARGGWQGR